MSNKIFMLLVVALLIYLLFFYHRSSTVVTAPDKQAAFYDFTLQTMDGKNVALSDYKGKVLIVDIWDTWCPPCKKGIPEFIDIYSKYRTNGLEILGVAIGQQGETTVQNFIRDYGINYTNVLATKSFLSGVGGITGIPTTFIIDQNGMTFRKYIGYTPQNTIESDIRSLLKP
jgi:thiol-disulfide isomerase/thioredoxin